MDVYVGIDSRFEMKKTKKRENSFLCCIGYNSEWEWERVERLVIVVRVMFWSRFHEFSSSLPLILYPWSIAKWKWGKQEER